MIAARVGLLGDYRNAPEATIHAPVSKAGYNASLTPLIWEFVMTMTHAQIPEPLAQQAQALIQHGWASNLDELVAESLRRYLESHQDKLAEQFIRDDVAWGLHGND